MCRSSCDLLTPAEFCYLPTQLGQLDRSTLQRFPRPLNFFQEQWHQHLVSDRVDLTVGILENPVWPQVRDLFCDEAKLRRLLDVKTVGEAHRAQAMQEQALIANIGNVPFEAGR